MQAGPPELTSFSRPSERPREASPTSFSRPPERPREASRASGDASLPLEPAKKSRASPSRLEAASSIRGSRTEAPRDHTLRGKIEDTVRGSWVLDPRPEDRASCGDRRSTPQARASIRSSRTPRLSEPHIFDRGPWIPGASDRGSSLVVADRTTRGARGGELGEGREGSVLLRLTTAPLRTTRTTTTSNYYEPLALRSLGVASLSRRSSLFVALV